jgi:cholesterol transport system auxiliary component
MIRPALLALLLLLPGCAGDLLAPPGPTPALYTLAAPKDVSDPGPAATWQLLVDEPSATLALNTSRIAIAPNPDRIDYYADVAWVDRAPALLQELILESFDRSGRIPAVQRQGGGVRADYILAVDLQNFEVDAARSEPVAHLRLTARLVRMRDRSIVASHGFEAQAPVGGGGFDGVIGGFDHALGDVLPQLVSWTLAEGNRG